ncbi:MAG: metallophosphoesterase [Proteobacteria bacterium]|nr:metallophosphoesterase [Pseudomonadota bacterium]
MYTLAHISDLHGTPVEPPTPVAVANKRVLGWLSWNVRRHRVHRPEVLEALREDLLSQAPDHVAVTGDLTNVALEAEFEQAAAWLRRLAEPDRVSVVPGNHDAYVRMPLARSWDRWVEYMRSDASTASSVGRQAFPTVRVRGPLALVGLCSAEPTPWFRATGSLGEAQRGRLREVLAELRQRQLVRVLLIHHPPLDAGLASRRRLTDARALQSLLADVGAELVLHGHRHRTCLEHVAGPSGEIPVMGVRSASDVGEREEKRAQYHLLGFGREPARLHVRVRGFNRASGRFADEREHWVDLPVSKS